MADRKRQNYGPMRSFCAGAATLILGVFALGTSAIADPTDFDASPCKSAFAAGNYSAAAKYCRTEAQATLNMVNNSHLKGDSKADALGIAAIQMQLTAVAQTRDGIALDAAQASRFLSAAKRLIHEALQSCASDKCRSAMQREADRIESWQKATSGQF